MSESSTSSVVIDGPIAEVAALLIDVAGYPKWLSSVKKVDVAESDSEGRASKATLAIHT